MASKDPKPVLGYYDCPDCEERGTVHQAGGRRSGYLYMRCGCGCDQRVGQKLQSLLWFETAWLDGLKPDSPPTNALGYEEYQAKYCGLALVNPEPAEPEVGPVNEDNPSDEVMDEDEIGNEPGTDAGSAQVKGKRAKIGVGMLLLGGALFLLRGITSG